MSVVIPVTGSSEPSNKLMLVVEEGIMVRVRASTMSILAVCALSAKTAKEMTKSASVSSSIRRGDVMEAKPNISPGVGVRLFHINCGSGTSLNGSSGKVVKAGALLLSLVYLFNEGQIRGAFPTFTTLGGAPDKMLDIASSCVDPYTVLWVWLVMRCRLIIDNPIPPILYSYPISYSHPMLDVSRSFNLG